MARTGSKRTDKSDEELIEMALGGDPQRAFDELFARYHKGVLANINKYVRDSSDAEDICMEAFEKAFRQISTYKSGNKFSTWLLAIARNTAIDHGDRERSKLRKVEKTSLDPADEDVAKVPDDTDNPEDEVINSEKHEKFMRCIDSLPELYREVATLRLVDNLGCKEIAEKTGLLVNTVKTRIKRAKEMMADKMQSADD